MQALREFIAGALVLALASTGSADIPKPTDVPPLINQLKTGPAKTRADAAKELGRIGQVKASYIKEAIPHLLRLAKEDKDDNGRKEAMIALGSANPDPDKVVPVMIEGLKAKNDQVKIAAAQALGNLGSEASEALPELRKVQEEFNKLSMDEKKKKRPVMQAVNQAASVHSGAAAEEVDARQETEDRDQEDRIQGDKILHTVSRRLRLCPGVRWPSERLHPAPAFGGSDEYLPAAL